MVARTACAVIKTSSKAIAGALAPQEKTAGLHNDDVVKRLDTAWIAALIALAFHLVANPHYGFFRDELYFIICGRHPAWGYVDQPPLVPLIAAGTQVFGISLFALRATAALCAAASVFVTCRLTRELRGGTFAQILAAICVGLAPVLLAFGSQVGPDMIGLWAWPLAALAVAKVFNDRGHWWWLVAGAALGIGGQAKYSVLFFGVALIVGIALSPQRRALLSRWFVGGLALALVIALPSALWQAVHGFPMLELLRNGQHGKNIELSPIAFLLAQLLLFGPVLSIVWICGVVWGFIHSELRWIAWSFVVLMALMIALHAKNYYPADGFAPAIVAGALAIEAWTGRLRVLRPVAAVVAFVTGIALLPIAVPALPEPQFIAYEHAMHLSSSAGSSEHHTMGTLPQDFADMHGWPQLAATVASVYDALPADERTKAAIAASNYGEAAAIDFFGAHYHLPPVISGHNQYWLWGTHGYTGDVVIDVNGDCGKSEHFFRSSRQTATFTAPYVMPYEDDMPIMVCKGITKPLAAIWPSLKNYI